MNAQNVLANLTGRRTARRLLALRKRATISEKKTLTLTSAVARNVRLTTILSTITALECRDASFPASHSVTTMTARSATARTTLMILVHRQK